MKNNKRYFYSVPTHVQIYEAAELFNFMASGEATKTEYIDRRNQCIFDNLERLMQQIGRVGTQELVSYLSDQNLLNTAGGGDYVKKVFNSLEPEEACYANTF